MPPMLKELINSSAWIVKLEFYCHTWIAASSCLLSIIFIASYQTVHKELPSCPEDQNYCIDGKCVWKNETCGIYHCFIFYLGWLDYLLK